MSDWIPMNSGGMPPQGVPVIVRRMGSEQIPMWEWKPIEESHCKTCQCNRVSQPVVAADNPFSRSWHHTAKGKDG